MAPASLVALAGLHAPFDTVTAPEHCHLTPPRIPSLRFNLNFGDAPRLHAPQVLVMSLIQCVMFGCALASMCKRSCHASSQCLRSLITPASFSSPPELWGRAPHSVHIMLPTCTKLDSLSSAPALRPGRLHFQATSSLLLEVLTPSKLQPASHRNPQLLTTHCIRLVAS